MDRETIQSRLRQILSKGREEQSPRDAENKDSASHSRSGGTEQGGRPPENRPIEPAGAQGGGIARLKWIFFVLALLYVLISSYHGIILTNMGRYLVVAHPVEKSHLIVCVGGGKVDRGLMAADMYQRGLAPKLFVPRQVKPDGYEILERRGVTYPESRELMISLLKGLGVPESSILTGDIPSENTLMEANHVKNLVKEKKYGSLLLVTSPIHSRRVWLTFRKAMSGQDVRITVIPSSYSSFNPETWWKNPRYLREVLVEYQKLIYFFFKGFI